MGGWGGGDLGDGHFSVRLWQELRMQSVVGGVSWKRRALSGLSRRVLHKVQSRIGTKGGFLGRSAGQTELEQPLAAQSVNRCPAEL